MEKKGFVFRVLVVVLAMLQPIVIVWMYGIHFPSISSTWDTMLQPLFIITNAVTSFFFFSIKRWRIPSFFLLMLTAFSVDFSPVFHNVLATLFFLTCVYPLVYIKRFSYYIFIYVFGLFIWLLFGLFWFEVFNVYVLCVYHLHIMIYRYKLKKEKKLINSIQ